MQRSVAARPIVLIWSHRASGDADPSACCATSKTASPSDRIVRITSAPSTASVGESTTVIPSSASGSAFSVVRFQALTSKPAFLMLRAMPWPMVPPAPRTATFRSLMIFGVPEAAPGHNLWMPVDATAATEPAVLEVIRFEWAKPDRIELVGVWTGLRAQRFMRPTLVLERDGEWIRLLALLEHKPWQAADGEQWTAAFAWDEAPVKFDSADLNVASGIDVKLPPPRMRPGKPRRFPHRAVSRDASRETEAATRTSGPGIVTDPVEPKRAPRGGIDPVPGDPTPAPP